MSVPPEQVQAAQQAPSVRIPKRFPLVTRPGFRSTTLKLTDPTVRSPVSDAALFNCYAELDPEDNQYWVQKRLGTKTLATQSGNAGGVGIVFVPGFSAYPVVIIGPTLYTWTGGVLVTIPYTGTHAATLIQGRTAQFVQIPPNNSVGFGHGVWAANGSLWSVGLNPGHIPLPIYGYNNAIDFITGAGPPWASTSLCDGCVYLDNVLYVMDQTGAIWGSNSNDITTWVATTVIQAGGRSDFPVALVQQLEYVIALKSTSFRCFYNSGAAAQTSGVGSNLSWVEGADGNYGCANAGSVQLIDQTLIWVSNNSQSTPQVVRMDGLQVQVISTPPVERLLQQLTMPAYSANPLFTANVLYSSAIKRGGHRFYTVTPNVTLAGGTPFTLVYDLDQQLWYLWVSPGRSYWSVCSASAADDINPGVYAQDISSGAFYVLDIDQVYPTDSGVPCQVDIYTANADLTVRRNKTLNAMYFVNDQVSGSKMLVRKSDDDYRSWSPFREVALNIQQPLLTRCGTFRRRALNIRHQSATPFRIKAGDAQIDIGVL
jgi:hypothetical protein